jgi:arabinogalactan oligomer/maltooligosaccharide transport system permease protein
MKIKNLPDLAALAAALIVAAGFVALPWFVMGDSSYTGFSLLTAIPAGVPRYEVTSLFLVLLGGMISLIASLVGVGSPRTRWITPMITAIGGGMAIFHFSAFFTQNATYVNTSVNANLAGVIGAGLWLTVIGALLLVLQVFLKRTGSNVFAEAFAAAPNARYAYIFIAPAVIVMMALVFYPLINGILLSFTNATQMNTTRVIGQRIIPAAYTFFTNPFENYAAVLQTPQYNFWAIFGQTVLWTTLNIVPHITIGLGLAILLNRKIRGRAVYRILLILPWAVPSYISAFVWRFLYNGDFGFFNNLLSSLHMAEVPWLSNPGWAMFAVVVANTWLAIPFNMVTMLGGLQSIPGELYEAAVVDGANEWQKFTSITLPLLRPVIMTITLLGVIWTFNSFNIIFLVSEGGPFRSTEILSTWAWRLGFGQAPQYGIAAAFSVIILVILIIFSTGYMRLLNKNPQGASA